MLAQKLMLIAIGIIIIGVIILVISAIIAALQQQRQPEKIKTEVAVGGFIGPFPFGFFTSRRAFWLWVALAALVALFLVIWFLARR